MYSRDIIKNAKDKIAARRQTAEQIAEARRNEVARLSPEIAEIDKELKSVGLQIFRAACSGEDITPIKEHNLALSAKRKELIKKLGFPENYTDTPYTCKICSDTGYNDILPCSCLREALMLERIAASGMGKLIEKQSFENFDLDWYGKDTEARKRAEYNLDFAKKYAGEFKSGIGNLLLIGSTGTGKTHISTSIAKEVIFKGYDVLYDSVQNIISDFEADRFRSGYSIDYEPKAEKYLECDLLIIDDLGTEFVNQFTVSCLYNLINTRQNKGLATIISTNLSAEELGAKYEGRIYSRIIGSDYTVLSFEGRDHRIFS